MYSVTDVSIFSLYIVDHIKEFCSEMVPKLYYESDNPRKTFSRNKTRIIGTSELL